MNNKAFKSVIAMLLSLSMVFSLVPMMAVNAETYYKSTPMTFTGVTKSTLGMTVSEYSGVASTVADYDIVPDPDATSGQGNVLKMFATPTGKDPRLWYNMEESVTGIVKLGFKVKIDKAAVAKPKGCILRSGSAYIIGIDGDYFYAGWNGEKDSLGSATKLNGWNEFTLYMDVTNRVMLAIDLNGTIFTGDAVNGSADGFDARKNETSLSNLNFAPTQFSLSANMTTYYDDITIEELSYEPKFGAVEIYASPTAGDTGDGTIENPYTLAAAQQSVRDMVSSGTVTDIKVILRGGTYYFDKGLTFTNEDGSSACAVTYVSYEGEKAVLTNAVSLDGSAFRAVTDRNMLARIPKAAHNKVMQADLNDLGVTDFGTMKKNRYMTFTENSSPILTVNNKMQTLARWPNAGWAFQGEILNEGKTSSGSFKYTEEVGDRWKTATDAWYHGFGYYLWADEGSPVSFDTENKQITLKNTLAYGLMENRPYYIYNLIEELDAPGEWYLDRDTGILYIYPESPLETSSISYATSSKAVITLQNASNITFEGLVIEGTCAEGVDVKNNSINNTISNCEIRNLGMVGVDIESGSRENKILNSHFHDLCKTGINIKEDSADFTTLAPTNNVVENCHIENFALTSFGYMAGIRVYGIGNKIAHNRINGGKHLAIYLNGNDNVIEYNDIYNVMNTAEDMAAIYCWSDWTNLGHIVRYNSIHNISGPVDMPNRTHLAHSIYFDDAASNATIYGNIIANVDAGIYTNGGSYHNISNNIFINSNAFSVNMYNWSSQTDENIVAANTVLMNSIAKGDETWAPYGDIINHRYRQLYWEQKYPSGKAAYDAKYKWLSTFLSSDPFIPKHNTLKGNVSIGANNKTYGKAFRTSGLVNTYGTISDNLLFPDGLTLVDAANGNYNVADYSNILSSIPTFERLDITKMGTEENGALSIGEFSAMHAYVSDVTSQKDDVMFYWEPASGADVYCLQIATDSSFKNIVYNKETGYTFKCVDGLDYNNNTYFWRVLASSTSHAYSGSVYNKNGSQRLYIAGDDTYKYTQNFNGLTKSDIGIDTDTKNDFFYTNDEYDGVDTSLADYDIVNDPDANSGQGKVLKMFATPSKYGPRLWYKLEESVSGIVKLGFKVKIVKNNDASSTGIVFRINDGLALGVNGNYFYVGHPAKAETSMGSATKMNEWNTVELYLNTLTRTLLSVELNGTKYTTNLSAAANGYHTSTGNQIDKLGFGPTCFALSGGNMTTYYDDITIKEMPSLNLVSSSVKNGDTNVAWMNNIELKFDKKINASTANNITLSQNGANIPVSVITEGERVLVRHQTLASNAQCTLTVPTTVISEDSLSLVKAETITFTPADNYTVDIDFENMVTSDLQMGAKLGYGVDFYANNQYASGKGENSKVEIVEKNGNNVIKFTNNNPGWGYLFLPLNQTFNSGLVEVSFKTKLSDNIDSTYMPNYFEFYPGITLLGQKFSTFWCGWDVAKATEITSMKNNNGWNAFKYIVDFDNDKVYFVVNEGTENEAKYHKVMLGDNDISTASLNFLRLGPTFAGGDANQGYTAYYDDIVLKRIPTPTSGLVLAEKTVEGTLGAGNDITIKAAFNNGTTALKNATAVAALYSEGGKLKAVKKATINNILPTEIETASIPMTLPEDYVASDYIRVFGIEGFSSLKPLGESK